MKVTISTDDTIDIMYDGYLMWIKKKGHANFATKWEFNSIVEYLAMFAPLMRYREKEKKENGN